MIRGSVKKISIFASIVAAVLCVTFSGTYSAQAAHNNSISPRLLAQEVGNQDPDAPDFAPGEKADGTLPETISTPTVTATVTTTSSSADTPTKEEILDMTRNDDSGGVGLLGALLMSPIVSMIVYFIGFLILAGIIVLIVVLIVRGNRKASKHSETPKSNPDDKTGIK